MTAAPATTAGVTAPSASTVSPLKSLLTSSMRSG
ncbi:hypothetical protein EYF80_046886 [Liparis tanakae]|uniref:Uncharacterized protein n=1 Tax=Liparis tanakae TaxID=230148 RepID=A0A4Z2FQ36_9TELE|nr:hypothetical protein EYF80_046886 [Liparis tanakae]